MKFADSAKILFDTEFLHCKTLVDPSVSRITRLRDKFSRLDFECKCDQKLGATKFASIHEKFSSTFPKISGTVGARNGYLLGNLSGYRVRHIGILSGILSGITKSVFTNRYLRIGIYLSFYAGFIDVKNPA